MAEAEPTSPWQPTSAPEIEALCLMMPPIAAARQQEAVNAIAVCADAMIEIIADHGGNNARRAIGGGRHDLAAGRILLIHRHGIDTKIIHHLMRLHGIAALFGLQFGKHICRAALHLQSTGQLALLIKPAIDASLHHRPNAIQIGIQRFIGTVQVSLARFIAVMERPEAWPIFNMLSALLKG